jgi:two-component system OmpR family response regulator
MSKKILLVEDDETLLGVLKYNLEKEGYQVATSTDGANALELSRKFTPDMVVLDIMLPGLDGFEVCRILRKESSVPVLMLTAKTQEVDKVIGLELGADDYMTKPFSIRELSARIKAILRRSETPVETSDKLVSGDLVVDLKEHKVKLSDKEIELSPKEFDLLAFMMRHKKRVFSRSYLLDKVWSYDFEGDERTVDVHIRWLRQKIETDPSQPKRLLTVRGSGYKFEG